MYKGYHCTSLLTFFFTLNFFIKIVETNVGPMTVKTSLLAGQRDGVQEGSSHSAAFPPGVLPLLSHPNEGCNKQHTEWSVRSGLDQMVSPADLCHIPQPEDL